jgi:phosphate-selective porin OprO and OprP
MTCVRITCVCTLATFAATTGPDRALAAPEAEAPPAVVTADERGLAVKSANGSFAFRVRGLVQVDGRFYLDDPQLDDRDAFLIRRGRPILEATLLGMFDFRLVPDFAEGRAQVFDANIDVRVQPWLKLRAGKLKPPIGLERLQSDPDLPFMERALTANLSPTRDVGLQLFGDVAAGLVSYALGVFDGAPDNASVDGDSNHGKDLAGRLFIQPLAAPGPSALGSLSVGVAASVGDQRGTLAAPALPSYRSSGQNTFFTYLTGPTEATTVLARGRHDRLNPGVSYYVGPVGLLAEYIVSRQRVRRGDDVSTLTHRAWHATASVAIGGKVSYEGVTPRERFDKDRRPRTWGALELAGRIGQLTLDEDTFPRFADAERSARKATGFGVALSWYLARSARCAVDFDHTWFEAGAAGGDRPRENALMGRMQLAF